MLGIMRVFVATSLSSASAPRLALRVHAAFLCFPRWDNHRAHPALGFGEGACTGLPYPRSPAGTSCLAVRRASGNGAVPSAMLDFMRQACLPFLRTRAAHAARPRQATSGRIDASPVPGVWRKEGLAEDGGCHYRNGSGRAAWRGRMDGRRATAILLVAMVPRVGGRIPRCRRFRSPACLHKHLRGGAVKPTSSRRAKLPQATQPPAGLAALLARPSVRSPAWPFSSGIHLVSRRRVRVDFSTTQTYPYAWGAACAKSWEHRHGGHLHWLGEDIFCCSAFRRAGRRRVDAVCGGRGGTGVRKNLSTRARTNICGNKATLPLPSPTVRLYATAYEHTLHTLPFTSSYLLCMRAVSRLQQAGGYSSASSYFLHPALRHTSPDGMLPILPAPAGSYTCHLFGLPHLCLTQYNLCLPLPHARYPGGSRRRVFSAWAEDLCVASLCSTCYLSSHHLWKDTICLCLLLWTGAAPLCLCCRLVYRVPSAYMLVATAGRVPGGQRTSVRCTFLYLQKAEEAVAW